MTRSPWRIRALLFALLLVSTAGMVWARSKLARPGSEGGDPEPVPAELQLGSRAPALGLPYVTGPGAEDGDRAELASFAGKPIVLEFWASWCGPCRQSAPILSQVHERYAGRVAVLGINIEDELARESIAEAHRDFGAHFPSLRDEGGRVRTAYRVDSVPTLVVIDGRGTLRWIERGVPTHDELVHRIEPLLPDPG